MRTGEADERAPDVVTADALGFMHRGSDSGRERGHIGNGALFQAATRLNAEADDENIFRAHFPDNRTNFGCADINTDD